MRIASTTLLLSLALALGACGADTTVGTGSAALTGDQCDYFEQNGKVTICHATGSATNPFRVIRVALDACVNAHAEHAGDFVAVNGDCGPGACLADGAPCDATLPCCEGSACNADGTCERLPPPVQTEFVWEVSYDSGLSWHPAPQFPDAPWYCDWCQRQYRTFITGTPSDVTLKFASDNQAQLLINGHVASIDYSAYGFWCTQAACCSQCCDNFSNCTAIVDAQTAIELPASDLVLFDQPVNELRWVVNEEFGGEGFHTIMAVTF